MKPSGIVGPFSGLIEPEASYGQLGVGLPPSTWMLPIDPSDST